MRAVVLFSGGKDSVYALWCVAHQGYDVGCLLTLLPAEYDSWMFHRPLAEWTSVQAQAMGFPHVMRRLPAGNEQELSAFKTSLRAAAKEHGGDYVVSGVIRSSFQKRRIDAVSEQLGLKSVAPLWGKTAGIVLREIVETGFEVVVSAVAARGLEEHWIGRPLTAKSVEELRSLADRYGFDVAGEGGELETFVLDGPMFKRRVRLLGARAFWHRDSGHLMVTGAYLADKSQ